jgi:RsiW-degrading membrane proteinase PrsW (M82 family)
MTSVEADSDHAQGVTKPELPASALSIITTEHFALQGARSATISESTGRAGMFLSAVSGGLVALGLIATATQVGTAFYAFGLALLPPLALIGLMTFERVLQSGIEDHGYARRISRLRAFYFEHVPQLMSYMPRVPAEERLSAHGLARGRLQGFLTAAGMVAVVTAVLVGGTAGLLCSVLFNHSLAPALSVGVAVALAALFGLTEYQRAAWSRHDRSSNRPVMEAAR